MTPNLKPGVFMIASWSKLCIPKQMNMVSDKIVRVQYEDGVELELIEVLAAAAAAAAVALE